LAGQTSFGHSGRPRPDCSWPVQMLTSLALALIESLVCLPTPCPALPCRRSSPRSRPPCTVWWVADLHAGGRQGGRFLLAAGGDRFSTNHSPAKCLLQARHRKGGCHGCDNMLHLRAHSQRRSLFAIVFGRLHYPPLKVVYVGNTVDMHLTHQHVAGCTHAGLSPGPVLGELCNCVEHP
jgi:hypothetical protein